MGTELISKNIISEQKISYEISTSGLAKEIHDSQRVVYWSTLECTRKIIQFLNTKTPTQSKFTTHPNDFKNNYTITNENIESLNKSSIFIETIFEKIKNDRDFLDIYDENNSKEYIAQETEKIFNSLWSYVNLNDSLKEKSCGSKKFKI